MITDYTTLLEAVKAYPDLSGETDVELWAPLMVQLGEAKINRELRLRDHLATISTVNPDETTISEYLLPSDANEIYTFRTYADNASYEYRPVDEYFRPIEYHNTDVDGIWTLDGRILRFTPAVTGIVVRYYKSLPYLGIGESNWLLLRSPGLYLYAALCHLAVFSKEEEVDTSRYEKAYEIEKAGLLEVDEALEAPRNQPIRARQRPIGWRST